MGNTISSKRRVTSRKDKSLILTNQFIQRLVSSQHITDALTRSIHEQQQLFYKTMTVHNTIWTAQCKIYGFGIQKNVPEGFRQLLTLKHFKEAFYPIACFYYEKKKYDYAFHYFYKLRKENHFAQYRLALMLFRGQGTLVNHEKAFRYMKLAALNNNKYAQFISGFYYEHGMFVKQSISTAKSWYERSANQGFSDAQLALANLLLNNIQQYDNTKQLKKEALSWLFKAVEQKNANAYIRLGALHEEGVLLPRDMSQAIENYENAVHAPFVSLPLKALGHYLIGMHYRAGEKVDESLAFHHLKASSNAGYAPAQHALGLMYAKGIGTVKNDAKARRLFENAASQSDDNVKLSERAAKEGSLAAQLSLAELYQRTGQLEKALQWYDVASHNTLDQARMSVFSVGFVSQRRWAQLMVARYQYNGWGVKQDPLLAFNTFRTLSENGFSDAHYWLAACYEEGIRSLENSSWVVQPNPRLAFELYKRAANAGDLDGQFQVAYMLSNGIGVQKDAVAAVGWYQKAAERGHTMAQYSLGMYYELSQDLERAKKWYQAAADDNSQLAMVRLAKVLVLSNSEQAIAWLKKAIGMGNVSALRELAALYKDGYGVNPTNDYKIAFDYYQKAADQDDALSWCALSEFYQGDHNDPNNIIVPENFDEAVRCLKKSIDLGHTWSVFDLADLYRRHDMTDDAIKLYIETANKGTQLGVIKKARIEAARMIMYENYGDDQDQLQIHAWLMELVTNANKFPKGTSEVFELLGYCSENGIGTTQDKDAAIQFYNKCINDNESSDTELEQLAKQRSLCRLIYHCMEHKNYLSAYTYLELLKPGFDDLSKIKSADAKTHARCMKYYLGYLLMYGLGTNKNIPESIYWFSRSAKEGEGNAFYELGNYYSQLDEDSGDTARDYYEQGVSVGHAGCMRQLALFLLEEELDQAVLDEDYDGGAEILDLLKNASNSGDIEATFQLGRVYENGLGDVIPMKDIDKALEYYLDAADHNHELAIMRAGEILCHLASRHEEAIELFRKADILYGNIKAKVMLISYNFQGFYIKDETGAEIERNDVYNFKKLQAIINKEIHTVTNENADKRAQERQSMVNKEGLGLAFYIFGQCYELGRGTLVDIHAAKECYFRSVAMSEHIDSMWRLGVICMEKENNDMDALSWFRLAAEKGKHCESHYQLGLFHLNGLAGLEKNMLVAKKHFAKAVEQGHPLAMFELGQIVWSRGEDYFYAYELYKTSGEQFHVAIALRELGHLSHTGFICDRRIIIPQNYKTAFAYYCQAAQIGDAVSALMIGNYFEEGYIKEGLGKNRERALQWYESAYRLNCGGLSELAIGKLKHTMANSMEDPKQAEDIREEAFAWFESAANHLTNEPASAKIMVALYYLNGWGRKRRNPEMGFHMLAEIADSGCNEAYIPVAQCYEEGIGIECNMNKALTYWLKAADLNSPEALFRVGEFYEFGLTGTTDRKLASTYYHKANLAKSKSVTYHHRLQNSHTTNRDSQYSLDPLLSSSSTSSSSPILSQ